MTITFKIPYGSMAIHLDMFLETAKIRPIRTMFKLIRNPENWRDEGQNLSDIRDFLTDQMAVLKDYPERNALLKKYEKLLQEIRKIGGETE